MTNQPLISIITVVYNGEAFLEQTIQSVINQTYENIEYIIIDGGSTDKTVDIIKKYENKIDYWISEKDDGIYDAMNKGIDRASGDFVNFMNGGDTFYDKSVLENIFKDIKGCSDKAIFGKAITAYNDRVFVRYENFDFSNPNWYISTQPSHQAIFIPKSIFEKKRFDTNLKIAADVEYIKYALKEGYCYRDIIIANFEFGGVSTYFGTFQNLLKVLNDIDILYTDSLFLRVKFYIFNISKYIIQKILGEKNYLGIYTLYLTRYYTQK